MNPQLSRAAGALALSALLLLAPNASAQQAVLSGTTNGLNWTLYGPGQLGSLDQQADTLKLSAHPQATVTGAKYGDQSAALSFRVDAPLQTVYAFHDAQLRAQGFTRTSQNVSGFTAQAVYARSGSQFRLTVAQQGRASYRATLDLGGVQVAGQPRAQPSTAATSAATATTPTPSTPPVPTPPVAQAAPPLALPPVTPPTATPPAVTSPVPVQPPAPEAARVVAQITPGVSAAPVRAAPPIPALPATRTGAAEVLVSARDSSDVQYLLYGPDTLGNLNDDPGMVSFSIPQGLTVTGTSSAASGLMVQLMGNSLDLQQIVAFYDRQFTAQGFGRVVPIPASGAAPANASTSVYLRGAGTRVDFSVQREGDAYRLAWTFRQP